MIEEDSHHCHGTDPVQAGDVRQAICRRHKKMDKAFDDVFKLKSMKNFEQTMDEVERKRLEYSIRRLSK